MQDVLFIVIYKQRHTRYWGDPTADISYGNFLIIILFCLLVGSTKFGIFGQHTVLHVAIEK